MLGGDDTQGTKSKEKAPQDERGRSRRGSYRRMGAVRIGGEDNRTAEERRGEGKGGRRWKTQTLARLG